MAKQMMAKEADVKARELLEESERYAVAKVTGNLAGLSDRTGQIKWQIEDARGRLSTLLSKFSRYFTPEETEAMRAQDAELAGYWDTLHRAYAMAQKLNTAVTKRTKESAPE